MKTMTLNTRNVNEWNNQPQNGASFPRDFWNRIHAIDSFLLLNWWRKESRSFKIIILKHIWHKTSFYLPKVFLTGEGKGSNLGGQVDMLLLSAIALTDFIKAASYLKHYILFTYLLADFTRWHPAINHSVSCPVLFLSPFLCLSAPFAAVATPQICLLKLPTAVARLAPSVGPRCSLSLKKSKAQVILSHVHISKWILHQLVCKRKVWVLDRSSLHQGL